MKKQSLDSHMLDYLFDFKRSLQTLQSGSNEANFIKVNGNLSFFP